jgi:biotin carboxylase
MIKQEIWLVAVTAGRWQIHGICEAQKSGIKVLALDSDPNAIGFKFSDCYLNIDLSEHDMVIAAIKRLNKNICGSVSFCSEAGMILAAKIREAFNLTGLRSEECIKFINKEIQREIWAKKNVAIPAWKVFSKKKEAMTYIAEGNFPVIIKPIDSSGSRGVNKIENIDEDFLSSINLALKYSKSGKIIIEEYMDGIEFTVETFSINGQIYILAITEKKKIESTRDTVAYELASPDRSEKILKRISDEVIKAFEALQYKNGPGHAEVILKKNGSVGIIEVAARGGGFMVNDGLVPAVSGVNVALLTAMQAVNQPIKIAPQSNSKFAVLRFFPSKPGILVSISGFEEANSIRGVTAESIGRIGDFFNQAKADGDRLGYVLAVAKNLKAAIFLANKAESLISFNIKERKDFR